MTRTNSYENSDNSPVAAIKPAASASITGLPDRVDDDAPCCWICFDEGPDDDGAPLIRNCSCRGTSGFVHLSCAVNYAENKSRQAYERGNFSAGFFKECRHCEQDYQGAVQYDMAKAQLEFVEREFKNNHKLYLDVLVARLCCQTFFDFKDEHRPEREVIYSKMLSIIEELDKDPSLQHDRLTHSMATAHHIIGAFRQKEGSEYGSKENLEKAKENFERAKDLYEAIGEELEVMAVEKELRMVLANLNGNEVELDATQDMNYFRKSYNHFIRRYGESDLETIHEGIELAIVLHKVGHTIEAQRLLTKLAQICRRVHGLSHNITERTLAVLERVKVRHVYIEAERNFFQALRYENDGEKIVVRGPSLNERYVNKQKTLTVESKDIIPMKATPVVVQTGFFQELMGDAVWVNQLILKLGVEPSKAVVDPTIVFAKVMSFAMVAYAIVSFFTGGRGLFAAMCFGMMGVQLFFGSYELKDAVKRDYLNGKIGEIGDVTGLTEGGIIYEILCEIHFEEEGLKPTKVSRDNVRILFDLSEEK